MRAPVQQLPVQASQPEPAPAKRGWWPLSLQDLKSKAVYDVLKFFFISLITAAGGTQLAHWSLIKAPYIALVAAGIFLGVRMFLPSRNPGQVSQAVAIGFLRADCELLLGRYKELMFDHREDSRLPLNHSSWPNFGQPFEYVDVSLATHSRIFSAFYLKVQILWHDLHRTDEPKLLRIGDYSRMDQVVDALEEMDRLLTDLQKVR